MRELWTLKNPTNHENNAAKAKRRNERLTLTQLFNAGVRNCCGGGTRWYLIGIGSVTVYG